MGTPDFAATILDALIAAGHRLLAVYTQPPRPAGRGHRLQPSPVQLLAERHGLMVALPASLRDAEAQAGFAGLDAEAAVVAAYGLILPQAMLDAPRLGCLNVHASLLPRWRGAAPVQRAILAGDSETGITIMQMEEGLDTGPIAAAAERCRSPRRRPPASLTADLARLGGRADRRRARAAGRGASDAPPATAGGRRLCAQDQAATRGGSTGGRPAAELERRVRALDPWPGAFFTMTASASACSPRR